MRLMRRVKNGSVIFGAKLEGREGWGGERSKRTHRLLRAIPYEVYLLWSVFMADLVIAIVRLKMMLELD